MPSVSCSKLLEHGFEAEFLEPRDKIQGLNRAAMFMRDEQDERPWY